MNQYLDLLEHIMEFGDDRDDRTGVGTRSVFGYQLRIPLSDGFPLLTTKKMHTKSIIWELLWFLRGGTNAKWLQERGVSIWDEWAREDGDLGPVYGKQWRAWEAFSFPSGISRVQTIAEHRYEIDQIKNLVLDLKSNPFSRRHIVSAWNPADLGKMALPPCHTLWQCYVHTTSGMSDIAHSLSLHLYARSIDAFLGLPFNIASYAFLLSMLAQVAGLYPRDIIISFGDLHIYHNHFDQVRAQLTRTPFPLPQLILTPHGNIDDYQFEDFTIAGYKSHPAIKAPIAA